MKKVSQHETQWKNVFVDKAVVSTIRLEKLTSVETFGTPVLSTYLPRL